MTRRAAGRDPWRGILLSGLVFPGLGQWTSGHPWRALAFAGSSVALLAAVVLFLLIAFTLLPPPPQIPPTPMPR